MRALLRMKSVADIVAGLEGAVGNVAVAIAWSGYFSSLLRFFGVDFPFWLCHSYRDVMLSYSSR